MIKKLVLGLNFLLITILLVNPVYASGFNLKSIGGVNVDGRVSSHWYHTSLQPALAGEAPGSSAVDVIIDGQAYQTAANAAEEWQFTPPAPLSAGDHTVVLKNNGSEISFTLTLGQENVNWDAVSAGGGESLPTVGFLLPTLFLLGAGSGLTILGRRDSKE